MSFHSLPKAARISIRSAVVVAMVIGLMFVAPAFMDSPAAAAPQLQTSAMTVYNSHDVKLLSALGQYAILIGVCAIVALIGMFVQHRRRSANR